MGEINVPRSERDALNGIDVDSLEARIEECLRERCVTAVRTMGLERSGLYVASSLRQFATAIADYEGAKSAKKLAQTEAHARRAGDALAMAVQTMKARVEQEQAEEQRFYVDDLIAAPYQFGDQLSVRVNYRWRATSDDRWTYGSIMFTHRPLTRPNDAAAFPRRKASAAKQQDDRQDALHREWQHLMRLGLYAVKEFLHDGGSPKDIPETFRAKTDGYRGELNNFSACFWSTHRPSAE